MKQALVDVDGVCLDFLQHVLDTVPGGTDVKRHEVHDWDIFDRLGDAGAEMKRSHLEQRGWWAEIPPMPGAIEGVAVLRNYFEHVCFVSAPWWSCFGWESQRRKVLCELFGAEPHEVLFGSLKHLVRGDWFVDDKPETVAWWQRAQEDATPAFNAWVFDAPYNQKSAAALEVEAHTGLSHRFTWESFLATPSAFLRRTARWPRLGL